MTKLYAPITKSEELEDGTIKVWGYASTDAVDSDGEIITSDAIKAALPDYMEWGAVREMHGSSAAGTAIEACVLEDGKTFFGCHVIDPVAVNKVKKGVYKGFSIGGKVTKRNNLNKNLIEGIILVEVSLVDRPANPGAKFTMFKANIDKTEIVLDNKDVTENNNNNMPDNNNEKPQKVTKSFYDVARLSSIVQELVWLQTCIESDNEWKDNQSSIPEELKNVISALGGVLVNQVAEEVENISPEQNDGLPVIDQSEKSDKTDLEKSGSRHSKSDKEKIQAIMDALVELGADLPVQDDKKDVSEKFAKFENDNKELEENLNKSLKTNEELTKRIKEFEAMPRPAKGSLGAFSKSDDTTSNREDKMTPVYKTGSKEEDETATAIKKAFQNPTRFF